MQTTNVIYRAIINSGKYRIEYKVEIAGETYLQSDIVGTPEIATALFDKFSVGNAPSSTLKVSLVPKSVIPPMALVEVYFRAIGNNIASVYFPKGKFYIDTRKLNTNGVLDLECFDAMLKGEYTFMESGSWTSTTALAVVQMIASDMGVNINSDTLTLLTNTTKTVPNVPVIGEDGTTGREMLCYIASMYGGNFIIDELGELKLIQLIAPTSTANIGVLASDLDTAPPFDAIDRVIMKSDDETGYRSPEATFDQLTGRILEVYCPWTSQTLADGVLSIVNGYVYQPLKITGANLDPACQLGDGITVNGTTSVIFSEIIHLDARCASDISAPYEEEVNHEYPYRSAAERKLSESVTQEQLATAGQTTINGSNIHSGTIILGGDNNGEGQMVLLDANNNEIGRWDNSRTVIRDDTQSGFFSNGKFAVIRKDAPSNTPYGVFMGTTQLMNPLYPVYPDESVPFIYMAETLDGSTKADEMFLSTKLSSGGTVTRTSGLSIFAQSVNVWGKVAQITLSFKENASYSAGSDIFVGTISSQLPKAIVTGCGYYGSSSFIGTIDTSGNIRIRAIEAVSFSDSYTASISFTYLF